MDSETIRLIVVTALSSSGLWAVVSIVVQHVMQSWEKKHNKNTAADDMLRGLGHDRIIYLCQKYMERGSISAEEFEDLETYLFIPYQELGGNGTAERLMEEVRKLPIKSNK